VGEEMPQHLLLVDDEPNMLIAFKQLLQEPEVTVDIAEDFPVFPGKKDWIRMH
jgi:hypothetical protein